MSKIVDKPAENLVEILSLKINKDLVDENVLEFGCICENLIKLYAAKNHDYGNSFEEGCRKIGSGYPLGRILDKVNRLIACMGKEDKMQIDETIEDTLKDLANYSIMTLIFMYKKLQR